METIESKPFTFTTKSLESAEDLSRHWDRVDLLTLSRDNGRRYLAGIARSRRCVEEVLRLRYRVFNLELGEGLQSSQATGLDEDRFDAQMTHLALLDRESGRLVGTYRMQTIRHALANGGIYSAREFDLKDLEAIFHETVELGRACLAREHRTMGAVLQLWQGIAAYTVLTGSRYLVGCSSIPGGDPDDGWRALKTIRRSDYLHPDILVRPTEGFSCGSSSREFDADIGDAIPLPRLFKAYLKLGAKVISEPAVDREFGTVDFLMMLDGYEVKKSTLDVLE
jgi:putative hemolysin